VDNKNLTPPSPWRNLLSIHHAAGLFPALKPEELHALADDIREHGLQNPVVVMEEVAPGPDGTFRISDPWKLSLLDGIGRLDAMQKVGFLFRREGNVLLAVAPNGLTAPTELCRYIDPADMEDGFDPTAFVISANIHRRHLTTEQKRELIGTLLKATPEKSDRQIADQIKADHKTVGTVRSEMEGRGEIPHVESRTDTQGRRQPGSKSKPKAPPASKPPKPKAALEPTPKERAVSEVVAPDEELDLLREFARFVLSTAKSVSVDPKDLDHWKTLRGRVRKILEGRH
jgi:hypothetical protein